jgi:hypothetical protein
MPVVAIRFALCSRGLLAALRCLTAVLIGTLLGVGQGWLLSAMLGGAGDRSEAQVAKRRAPLIGVY